MQVLQPFAVDGGKGAFSQKLFYVQAVFPEFFALSILFPCLGIQVCGFSRFPFQPMN